MYFPFDDMKAPLYHSKTIFREVDTKHPMKFSFGDMREVKYLIYIMYFQNIL